MTLAVAESESERQLIPKIKSNETCRERVGACCCCYCYCYCEALLQGCLEEDESKDSRADEMNRKKEEIAYSQSVRVAEATIQRLESMQLGEKDPMTCPDMRFDCAYTSNPHSKRMP
eukprot:scaffold15829_cov83-Skeletonema_dohrnii-CCMP3373.AAC.1